MGQDMSKSVCKLERVSDAWTVHAAVDLLKVLRRIFVTAIPGF